VSCKREGRGAFDLEKESVPVSLESDREDLGMKIGLQRLLMKNGIEFVRAQEIA